MNIQLPITVGIISIPVIGIVSVVLLSVLRPEQDHTTLIVTILGFSTASVTSLLGLLQATRAADLAAASIRASEVNTDKIRDVHDLVNGQSEAMQRIINDEAFARGAKSATDAATVLAVKVAEGVAKESGK